jgi:hypothetical protein
MTEHIRIIEEDMCPCGRMFKPAALWLCRACYLEKEIRYAISELERGGDAWQGRTWHDAGLERLKKLTGWID